MTDARESEGRPQPSGFERMPPPKRPRIDEMFAGAMEEQLSEQRTLNEVLRRVESSLAEIRSELAEVRSAPSTVDAALAQISRELEEVRAAAAAVEIPAPAVEVPPELNELPARIEDLKATMVSTLAVRDDVDRLGTAGLLRRVEELREEVQNRLSARDEQAQAAISESIAALREHATQMDTVRASLSDQVAQAAGHLAELVESTTTGQQAALATMESATARIETLQHELRDRLAEILAGSVSDLQAASQK